MGTQQRVPLRLRALRHWRVDWMRWAGGWRIGWKMSRCPASQRLDVLFRIEQNTHEDFGGGLQLVLSDFRRSDGTLAASAAANLL